MALMDFFNLAISGTVSYWINLGINFILSTLIGGIVIAILLAIASKGWNEPVKIGNSFLLVLIVNLINFFGVLGLLGPIFLSGSLAISLIVWIVLTKLLFSQLKIWHAIVIGLIGFVLSIFVFPVLVNFVTPFIPTLG
jgi:hypothetical protein